MKGNKPICKKKNVVKKKKGEKGKNTLANSRTYKFNFRLWNGVILSQKKNEGIPFSAEIEVVGSYTDRLLTF